MVKKSYSLLPMLVLFAPFVSVQRPDPLLLQRVKMIKAATMEGKTRTFEIQKTAMNGQEEKAGPPVADRDRVSVPDKRNRFTVREGMELPPQLKRGGHMGGCLEGQPIIAGGTNWNEEKTIKSWLQNTVVFKGNHWVQGPALPAPLAYAAYGSDPTGFYIAGGTPDGRISSRAAYRLTHISGNAEWQRLPPLPEPVSYGSGAVLNGKFYVACGMNDSVKTNRMWVLDMHAANPEWSSCPPVPGVERTLSTLVPCGKFLYLLGGLGQDNPFTVLKDAYRYDSGNGRWQRLPDLPLEGYAWSGQPVDEDHILLTGRAYGKIDTGIWLLRLTTMTMKKIGATISPATTAPLIKIDDQQWWLVGGEPDANKNRTGKVTMITQK